MINDLASRIYAINWSQFVHPCGFDQSEIPRLLLEIQNEEDKASLQAALDLWNVAAHQGAACASAVPTTGFILEILNGVTDNVRVELMDILYQFSVHFLDVPWGAELLVEYRKNMPVFQRLARHTNEDVVDFSEMILEQISSAIETRPG